MLTQSPGRQTIRYGVPSVEDNIGQEEYREVPHLLQLHHEPHVELPVVGDWGKGFTKEIRYFPYLKEDSPAQPSQPAAYQDCGHSQCYQHVPGYQHLIAAGGGFHVIDSNNAGG